MHHVSHNFSALAELLCTYLYLYIYVIAADIGAHIESGFWSLTTVIAVYGWAIVGINGGR